MRETTTVKYFDYEHLSEHLHEFSKPFGDLARHMEELLEPGPEKSAMMRKLLEARDCAVRAGLYPGG